MAAGGVRYGRAVRPFVKHVLTTISAHAIPVIAELKAGEDRGKRYAATASCRLAHCVSVLLPRQLVGIQIPDSWTRPCLLLLFSF